MRFTTVTTVAGVVVAVHAAPLLGQEPSEAPNSVEAEAIDLSGNWRLMARSARRDGRLRLKQSGDSLSGLLTFPTRCAAVGVLVRSTTPARWEETFEGAVAGDSVWLRGVSARLVPRNEECGTFELDTFEGVISEDGDEIIGSVRDTYGRSTPWKFVR